MGFPPANHNRLTCSESVGAPAGWTSTTSGNICNAVAESRFSSTALYNSLGDVTVPESVDYACAITSVQCEKLYLFSPEALQ